MPAMKTLTLGVGLAALASAIGFIYAQATSDGPPLMPRFAYGTRQATPQRPMNLGLQTAEPRSTTQPSSAPATENGEPSPGNSD